MKDSISESSAVSEPYSWGSDGSSTTSWARRLLRGEYGTRRTDESMGTESAERHSPSFASTNDVRVALGSITVSRMVPSPRTAETAGIRRSFRASSAPLLGSGFAIGFEPFQLAECLPEAQMFDPLEKRQGIAVSAAAVAVEGFCLWIQCEGRLVIFVKRADADQGDSGGT